MSDKEVRDKEVRKAHIEEIELELPAEEEYIAPEEPKRNRVRTRREDNKKSLFQDALGSLRETVKAGTDVAKSYKDELLAKKEVEPPQMKPNSAFIDTHEDKGAEKQSTIEIEFAGEQKPTPKTSYKMSAVVEEKSPVGEVNQTPRPKKKTQSNRNRPSASASARAESFVGIFESEEEKKPLMSDKDFRKFVAIATTLLVLFGLVWYGFTYFTADDMSNVSTVSASDFPGPIKPSELFSSRTPEVVDSLGDPKASGSIDGTENSFFEYDDKWFGSESTSKVVYGLDRRVYFVDINYKSASMEKIYPEMVKYLGEPIVNNAESREATWFTDSCMYILSEEQSKATLNIQTSLYDNANGYPIKDGAIIIQKQGGYDITGDGNKDVVVIIGEKESYIFREFTKLHMTIWDGENVYYTGFPADLDGGANPKIIYEDIDKDGVMDISIETKNNAINNYNTFSAKNGAIVNIYASHEKTK